MTTTNMKKFFEVGDTITHDGEVIQIMSRHSEGVYDCEVYAITEDGDLQYSYDQYFTASELRTF